MADINTTARANQIANELIRPAADTLSQLTDRFDTLLSLASPAVQDWLGLFGQFSDKELLIDPDHQPDPRTPVTPESIKLMVFTAMQQFSDMMHANENQMLNLVRRIAVNPIKV